jgi:transposase
VVDAYGRPVQFALTAGQTHEMRAAGALLADLENAFVVGDRAYDSAELRRQLLAQGCQVVIPPHPTRKIQRRYDRAIYKLRHKVENFFQRLKRFRRIATRYEKRAASFFALVCLAAVLTWIL